MPSQPSYKVMLSIAGTLLAEGAICYEAVEGPGSFIYFLFCVALGRPTDGDKAPIIPYLLIQGPILFLLFLILFAAAIDEGQFKWQEAISTPPLYFLAIYLLIILIPGGIPPG
jgi:hypothetical protein